MSRPCNRKLHTPQHEPHHTGCSFRYGSQDCVHKQSTSTLTMAQVGKPSTAKNRGSLPRVVTDLDEVNGLVREVAVSIIIFEAAQDSSIRQS